MLADRSEEAVDLVGVDTELSLPMGIDVEDSSLVEGPRNSPVAVALNVPLGLGREPHKLKLSEFDAALVVSIDRIDCGEDLVKIDVAVGEDIDPHGVGDGRATWTADDTLLGKRQVTGVVLFEDQGALEVARQ